MTTEPGETTSSPPEPDAHSAQPPSSAVMIRPDQREFDARQVTALAQIVPGLENAPRAQLAVFFHYCVRTGLDPFARQIYLIGRLNRREDRVQYTIQTGIDGFRVIAHRAADRAGQTLSYEDTVYFDGEGRAQEVWLAGHPPAAVKVTVLRGASRFPFIARWGEFAPSYWDADKKTYVVAAMWRRMPAHMLFKCAEAGSLRMSAPHDLGGIYADEEMAQADAEQVAGTTQDAATRLRVAAGLEAPENSEPEEDSDGSGEPADQAASS